MVDYYSSFEQLINTKVYWAIDADWKFHIIVLIVH